MAVYGSLWKDGKAFVEFVDVEYQEEFKPGKGRVGMLEFRGDPCLVVGGVYLLKLDYGSSTEIKIITSRKEPSWSRADFITR
jgi:hypothetical protein